MTSAEILIYRTGVVFPGEDEGLEVDEDLAEIMLDGLMDGSWTANQVREALDLEPVTWGSEQPQTPIIEGEQDEH